MSLGRRDLFKQGAAFAAATVFAAPITLALGAGEPNATPEELPAELSGLDLYTVYRKMFSSTANDAKCCWWYFGTSKANVPDIGLVPTTQVETCMVYKTEDLGPASVNVYWKEVGAFRDIATGELPGPWLNPETGKQEPRRVSFEDGPAHYTISRREGGLHIDLDQAHAKVQSVTARFTVANGRVCITQTEDKVREVDTPQPNPIRTVLKIYASLDELKQPGKTTVKSSGFYTAGSTQPDKLWWSVNGLMQKAAVDEKLNPIGWERMRKAYPAFFRGDRVDPSWN